MGVRGLGVMAMNQHKIIMNFSAPPSGEDLLEIAREIMETLPEEILEHCETLALQCEEIADEATQAELEVDNPFELMALYRSGKEISRGVQRKVANDDDILILYRRPILDFWCELGDDLTNIIREVMIEELAQNFDFTEDEIAEMTRRHHQGML
jgi:predicted Zn-dependent protease with MMP-like domain